ncbi:MAG: ribonucleoside-diphosphate reductase alpha chain [Candidatus Omnitrophota bacterium]|jgi:ribonucleoside-diphosphate reductase alpha chain
MEDKYMLSQDFKVKKRGGQLVAFNPIRIHHAIANAFKQIDGLPREADLNDDMMEAVEKTTLCVLDVIRGRAESNDHLSVEGIQDEVIRQLYENGHTEVAQSYANYRREHATKRALYDLYETVKRDGKNVSFKPEKITVAIAKAFRASHDELTDEILDKARELSDRVIANIHTAWPEGHKVHIEEIQDLVERALMDSGNYDVARCYIVYREERRKARMLQSHTLSTEIDWNKKYQITLADDKKADLNLKDLLFKVQSCCAGLEDVVAEDIVKESLKNYYNGITEKQVDFSNVLAARTLIEKEPNYSFAAARLLLLSGYEEALGSVVSFQSVRVEYPRYLSQYIHKAVEHELLSPDLLKYDLEFLGKQIKPERDLLFRYMGLQTLYDRYFIHWEERRLEIPQVFWMRVAMGLAKEEKGDANKKAVEFYDILSTFRFVSSTPTLFNAGTIHSQLSSCYLSTISDDLKHIFKCMQDDALLSKWSGGLGNDWTNVRSMGSRIKGTNGKSQGIIPFLKVANDVAVAVNQGGKRQGAMCAYLETWHMDIEEFLELRKNTGDDRRRTHDMHTANWIPDLFMKRVKTNSEWTLFSPSDAPDLHHLYGAEFEKRYEEYEEMAKIGRIKKFKKLPAIQLWRKMITMLFETGHPWITWKDPSNIRSPQDHAGVVHSSNLCTEILLNTSPEETAVCNLGSVNIKAHLNDKGIDHKKLEETITTAIRMLDNVVDINYYPTSEAESSNLKHRPIGMGIMGFQDALYKLNYSYASQEAVEFADESMEAISYYAILASSKLAKEKGKYSSFEGSKWDRGLLPFDTVELLSKERGMPIDVEMTQRMDWTPVRESVKTNGMRNSNVMAIAPTATIGNISGVTASIEPCYKNIFVKSNLSGEFTVPNEYMVVDLKAAKLWDEEMINDLKYFDGSIQEIDRIPQVIKDKYPTAFEVEFEWVVKAAARRQKWIDMGQSLNLYQANTSGRKLNDMYMAAWESGLKTTYYLRSLSATRIEKSTIDVNQYGNVLGQKKDDDADAAKAKADQIQCSIENGSDCEACE